MYNSKKFLCFKRVTLSKTLKVLLLLLPILGIALYLFFTNQQNKKAIVEKPIKINPITIETKSKATDPSAILQKLKQATAQANENIEVDKEEIAKKVLETLKTKTAYSAVELKAVTMTEAEAEALAAKERLRISKVKVTKKEVTKKAISKKVKVVHKVHKITKKKIVKKTKVRKNIKIAHKTKSTKIAKTSKKIKIKKENSKTGTFYLNTHLSREEEVRKYANKLEVVGVSKSFEIKEPKNKVPDSYYFKDDKLPKITTSTKPIGYVKKLGVVKVSNAYEAKLKIPKKIEEAKEGIINISTASTETEELKKLKFVDSLGVVKVSKEFETIEAKKYLH